MKPLHKSVGQRFQKLNVENAMLCVSCVAVHNGLILEYDFFGILSRSFYKSCFLTVVQQLFSKREGRFVQYMKYLWV